MSVTIKDLAYEGASQLGSMACAYAKDKTLAIAEKVERRGVQFLKWNYNHPSLLINCTQASCLIAASIRVCHLFEEEVDQSMLRSVQVIGVFCAGYIMLIGLTLVAAASARLFRDHCESARQ